jgi:hypothetical protein
LNLGDVVAPGAWRDVGGVIRQASLEVAVAAEKL